MRPVDKGDAPAVYARYQDAGPDLRARLGDYCSYCERQIETNLAVEHVQPKSVVPALTTEWTNFLLACTNCNSTKGFAPVVVEDYFWPDADNTLRAFEYLPGGLVEPNPELSRTDAAKAAATLELTGLDRYPGSHAQEPTKSDQRWSRRRDTWQLATKHCKRLAVQDTAVVRSLSSKTPSLVECSQSGGPCLLVMSTCVEGYERLSLALIRHRSISTRTRSPASVGSCNSEYSHPLRTLREVPEVTMGSATWQGWQGQPRGPEHEYA